MIESIRETKDKKLGKALRMLKWISVAPGMDVETLGKLLDLSERGVYRYIADLRKLGIPIKTHEGEGYSLEDTDILRAVKWNVTEPEKVTQNAKNLG